MNCKYERDLFVLVGFKLCLRVTEPEESLKTRLIFSTELRLEGSFCVGKDRSQGFVFIFKKKKIQPLNTF